MQRSFALIRHMALSHKRGFRRICGDISCAGSDLRECDVRSNPRLILFGGAADRRHERVRNKAGKRRCLPVAHV